MSWSLTILAIHCVAGLLVFSLLARTYLLPGLAQYGNRRVLEFLLVPHFFRYLPLSLYQPGQVDAAFPAAVMRLVALGDLVAAAFAILAFVVFRSGSSWGRPLVWLFSLLSTADILLALTAALSARIYELSLGANYFTVAVYVPLLMVTQYFVFRLLLLKNEINDAKT